MPEGITERTGAAVPVMVAGGVGAALLMSAKEAVAEGIELSKVPAAVKEGAKKVAPDAKWSSAEKDGDGDETTFEVTGKDKQGHTVVVEATADGTVTEWRIGLALKDVPKAVWKGVAEKFPNFEAGAAYELHEGDELSYEVSGVYSKDLQAIVGVSAEGEIGDLERQIPVAMIPQTVLTAVKGKLPMFQPTTAFEVSDDGDVTGYQLTGKRGKGKKADEIDVFVSADGQEIEVDE